MNIFYFRITNNSEHYNHKRIKLIEAVEIAAQNKRGGGGVTATQVDKVLVIAARIRIV